MILLINRRKHWSVHTPSLVMIMLQACFANEKKLCWKLVCKDEWFLNLCAKLGTELSLTEVMYAVFEKYESPMGNVKKDLQKTNVKKDLRKTNEKCK